ncbi:MAG: hypothetical protein V4717_13830 [Bacteroidota bacterium]
MLKETFTGLLKKYTGDGALVHLLWEEVCKKYSGRKRHYHTLQHLENLLAQLVEVKGEIKNLDTVLFSLYYHDIVYNVLQQDNEEQSARLAECRMKQISVADDTIEDCKKMILATKSHLPSTDSDTNYFTDADLSVLGQDWQAYSLYCKNVRKEYSIYPNFIYNPGRKKVLNHFLSMDSIFKTPYFNNKFEVQAKQNMQKELALLNG